MNSHAKFSKGFGFLIFNVALVFILTFLLLPYGAPRISGAEDENIPEKITIIETQNVTVTSDKESELETLDKKIKIKINAGTVDETMDFQLNRHLSPSSTGMRVVNLFELNAKTQESDTFENNFHEFKKEMEITIQHTPEELAGLDMDSLNLYYLNEETRQWELIPGNFDRETLTLTAKVNHFSYFGEQANPLESGPGKVMAAQVGLHSGTATYSYPFELPPGPGGFTPSLTLNYNSGSVDGMKNKRDVGSWVGIGWSLNFGKISYDASTENYTLDLNGASYELIKSDQVHFRTQPEEYLNITKSGNTWTVYDKSGTEYRFGGTTDSEQYTDTSDYYRWDLSYWKDTNGNEATVSYVQDIFNSSVRSAYPEYLRYNNNLVEVRFLSSCSENDTYGPVRYDNPITYGSNSIPTIMENRQLDSIEIKVSGNLIRKYNFSYVTTDRIYSDDYDGIYYSGKHMLTDITQIGTDNSSSLPPTSFIYQYREVFRYANETEYVGNPGNPASLTWPFLSAIDSGYGGSVSFAYTQIPDTSVLNTWTRQAVTSKIINSGIGTTETYTYTYTGNPQYQGTGWDQEFRGWNEVQETDAAGNYIEHYFYTTGNMSGKDAEKLTGKEYQTKWYDSASTLLKTKNYDWNLIEVAGNTSGTMTFYPDANPESSSVDGYVNHSGGSYDTWSTIRNGVGTYYYDSNTQICVMGISTSSVGSYWQEIYRGIFLFDTSALPDDAIIITSATLSLYGSTKGDGLNCSPDVNVYGANPASNTGLAAGDYDSLGTTPYCDTPITYAAFTFSGYNDFELNDAGMAAISKNGITKFGTRNANYDVADITPTWMYSTASSFRVLSAECGLDYAPKLVVTMKAYENYEVQLDKVEETIGTKTTRTEYVYDDYGNVITEKRYGDISTGDDDSTLHRVYYANNSTAYIVNKPAEERVYATITEDIGGANLKKETHYYYDGNNASYTTPPTQGNLTRIERKSDASNSISSYMTYDAYGNLLNSQDPNSNNTTWTFETTYHVYPATKTVPLVGTEYYTYAPGTTNLLSMTDVNSQTTTYEYDTFQRLIKVIKPGDSSASPSEEYQYNNWGTLNYQNIKTITKADASTFLWQTQYFDGIGRVVQVHTNGETGHTIIASTTSFNNRGMVEKQYVSQDYASILTSYQEPNVTWKYSTSTYDGLGRVVTQTSADGTSISHDYSTAWQDTITNQRGYQTRFFYDAFQQLVKVEELNASYQLYATTTYSYDTLGNLLQVVDDDSNTTTITYDWLSNKLSMSDPDMGSWSYTYDNNGNLITQTDAKSQTITMVYDALNRLIYKMYPVGANMTNVYYGYDSGTYGIGQRTSMTDAVGTTTYTYDNRGRLISENRTIDSVSYVTSFTYDGANRPVTVTYPTGEVVTNTYDGRGLPYSLSGSSNTTGALVSSVYYNSLGSITEINLGNGLKTTYGYYGTGGAYDATGGYYGKLWEVKTLPQGGGNALQDVQHTWDAGSNLIIREDVLTETVESFEYDFLDRLTGAGQGFQNDWLGDWQYRVKITIDSSMIEEDEAVFPVLIHISSSCGQGGQDLTAIFDELGGNYKKLAVTTDDGQTQLYVEVVEWDATNEEALLRVSREGWTISGSEDTVIYLYFDNTQEDNSGYVIGDALIIFSEVESRSMGKILSVHFSEIEARTKVNIRAILDKILPTPYFIIETLLNFTPRGARDGGASGNYTETYTYNTIGNIMSRNGVSYTYGAKPHAVTSVGDNMTYTYDANGNMITRGDQTLTWDAENRLIAVTQNSTVIAQFFYDGDGNRVKKIENGETVLYVNRYYEKNLTTGNVTTSYYLGGRLVATKENAVLRYLHQDHLTGTSLMTDSSGNQIGETMKYLPFGETLTGSVPTDKKFTGQRLDETGLYYYGARYYDPTIGRFTSPDTIIPNPANPQFFNRYSYCLNNPLKYIDPTGYDVSNLTTNGHGESYLVPMRVVIGGVDITDMTPEEFLDFYNSASPEVQALLRAWGAFAKANPEAAQDMLDSDEIIDIEWGTVDSPLATSTSTDDEGNVTLTVDIDLFNTGADTEYIFGNISCELTIIHDVIYGPDSFAQAFWRSFQFLYGFGQVAIGVYIIWNTGLVGAYTGLTYINSGHNTMMDALGFDNAKIPFQLGPWNSAIPIRPSSYLR